MICNKLRLFSLSVFILLGFLNLKAQEPPQEAEPKKAPIYNLTTPRQSISRHLYYLGNKDGQYNPSISADALNAPGIEKEQVQELAIKLKQLYDAKGVYINPDNIPGDALYWDSALRKNRYVVAPDEYPEFYVEKFGNKWQYAPASVRSIETIYRRVIPGITRAALNIMPPILKAKFLGLEIWKYLGLVLMFVVAYFLFLLFKWIASLLIKRIIIPLLSRTNTVDVKLIPLVTTPLSLFCVVWVLKELWVPSLILPIKVSQPIVLVMKTLIPFFGVVVLLRFVDVVADLFKKITSLTESTFDDQAIPIIVKGAKLVIGVLGSIIILKEVGVNVTALLAGVSIGGLALALAAQDTAKNFIGSVSIFIDKPFVVGDFIATSEVIGVVVEVGLRSTRIRALDGAQVTIPNGKLVNLTITNHGVRTYRRYATTLGLTYGTPTHLVEKFVEGVKKIARNHPKSREDSVTVQFHEMADYSLNVFFAVIYDTVDYGDWLKARQEVFVDVMKLAEEIGVSFAFPSTSIYLENTSEGLAQ